MKLNAKISIRTGWNPEDLTVIKFRVECVATLLERIEEVIFEDCLLLEVSVWNEDKQEELRR